MVEGHTDNVPLRGGGVLQDNWDLSVKRATAVVRILQNQYGLDPARMAAAGRGEYKPIADNNSSKEGRRLTAEQELLFFLSWISFSNYWNRIKDKLQFK